jgi:hypothetical protein
MKTLLITLLAFPLLLTACGNQEIGQENASQKKESEVNTLKSAKHSSKSDKKVLDQMSSPGKPSAPINLDYSFNGKPTLGQPLSVNIKLTETRNAKPVTAALKYSPQLIENKAISNMSFKSSPQESSQVITITPVENGIYFINIQASTEVDGQTMYKAFSIPVEVGEVDWDEYTKPEGTINNDSRGGKVISFPAAE